VLDIVVDQTAKFLKKFGDFQDNPDIVEDFFGMTTKYMKFAPKVFFRSTQLMTTINLAFTGILLENMHAQETQRNFMMLLLKTLKADRPQLESQEPG